MKRFSLGILVGLLIGVFLATATIAAAAPNAIKLIINGQEIHSDVPPQMIDGRVMVPAMDVVEAIGADVIHGDNVLHINQKLSASTITIQTTEGLRIITFPSFSDRLIKSGISDQ